MRETVSKEEMEAFTLRNPEKLKEIQQAFMHSDMSKETKDKNKLTYLPWGPAWEECIRQYPQATYEIKKNTNEKLFGLPCFGNSHMGFMSYTSVTIEGITREMWLPIMDNKNKSMMKPTTFAINKTVMRCLVKNLAMFGLGMYIYKGEDLPSMDDIDGLGTSIDEKPVIEQTIEDEPKLTKIQEEALNLISAAGIKESQALEVAGVKKIEDLVEGEGNDKMVKALNAKIAKNKEKNNKVKTEHDKKVAEGKKISEDINKGLTEIQIEIRDLIETAGIEAEKAYPVAGVKKLEEIKEGKGAKALKTMLEKYIAKNKKK